MGSTGERSYMIVCNIPSNVAISLTELLLSCKDDLPLVLKRAESAGVQYILSTAGSLSESRETLKFCHEYGKSGIYHRLHFEKMEPDL